MNIIGKNIRKVRKSLNLSQEEFAKELGVDQGTVSVWEIGKSEPSYKMLLKIAEIANIPFQSLLSNEHENKLFNLFFIALYEAEKNSKLNELKSLLDNFVEEQKLSKITYKIRTMKGKNFAEKLAEACSGKKSRALIVLYYFILHLQNSKALSKENLKSDPKEKLIQELKSFKIPLKEKAKHLFAISEKDKKNLIDWIEENFDDLDAMAILIDLPKLKEEIKKEINYPNKALL